MYICKNCGTRHEEQGVACNQCHIEGMMIFDKTIALHNTQKPVENNTCKNCGTNNSVEAIKCESCNFPISRQHSSSRKSKIG